VTNLHDRRVAPDVRAHEMVAESSPKTTVGEIRAALAAETPPGLTPQEVIALGDGRRVELRLSRAGLAGRVDALFLSPHAVPAAAVPNAAPVVRPWREYVHHASLESFTDAQIAEWREHLLQSLPEYMVPAAWVRMERLPLTPTGKVDRKALRPPTAERGTKAYVAPTTEREVAMAALWAEVLRLERVGMDDGFLDLGGHSLLAMRIVARVRRDTGAQIPLDLLLRGATLAEFCAALEDSLGAAAAGPPEEDDDFGLLPVSRDAYRRTSSSAVK
jgi:acyl carrier protein